MNCSPSRLPRCGRPNARLTGPSTRIPLRSWRRCWTRKTIACARQNMPPSCRNTARRRPDAASKSASGLPDNVWGIGARSRGMTWQPELDELRRREQLAQSMGGPEKVARHHAQGRLTVRERIEELLDPGSFHEVGALTGAAEYSDGRLTTFRPANFICGTGRIDGRKVVIGG